mgnify:CR=1 FL=1
MNGKLLTCISIFLFTLAGCSPKEAGTTASNTSTPAETPMKLTGEASYRERIAVPPTAQVEILLEDVSRADAPAEIIGSQTIPNAGQPPYVFSIEYLPSKLVANHRYNLRARLTVNGELMFTTDQSYPVFVDGQENQTKLLMRRVARHASSTEQAPATDSTTTTSEFANTYWKLVSLKGQEVTVSKNQREPHLVFASDMRVSGSDGCNSLGGSYTADGSQLNLGQMISTQRACIEGGEQAHAFTMALSAVKGYQIQGNKLELLDENGAAIAGFVAVALQ